MKKAPLPYICILMTGLLLCLGCHKKSSGKKGGDNPVSKEQQDSANVRPEVVFGIADGKPLYSYIESSGVVKANRTITLKPRISGYVKHSNITTGRRVRKGDTLLAFVDQEFKYDLQKARNNYRQAVSEYNMQSKNHSLAQNAAGKEPEIIRNDTLVRIFSGYAAAKLNLEQAQTQFSYTSIEAPFSGKLATDQQLASGGYLAAGTKIGELIDDRSVRIHFDVLEAELNKVRPGMNAQLTTPGGDTLMGTVSDISPVVDTRSKTGQVIVKAANDQGTLKPGMTVDGRIRSQSQTGKARIPRAAILSRDGGRTLVFKLHPNTDEVEWIYVSPKAENSDWAIVDNKDIKPGDTLAVDNHFSLSHLQKVRPKMRSRISGSQLNASSN